jgi:hypothetical protein
VVRGALETNTRAKSKHKERAKVSTPMGVLIRAGRHHIKVSIECALSSLAQTAESLHGGCLRRFFPLVVVGDGWTFVTTFPRFGLGRRHLRWNS